MSSSLERPGGPWWAWDKRIVWFPGAGLAPRSGKHSEENWQSLNGCLWVATQSRLVSSIEIQSLSSGMSAFCLLGHSRLKGFGKGVPGREVRFPPDGKEGDPRSGAITDSLFFWHPPTHQRVPAAQLEGKASLLFFPLQCYYLVDLEYLFLFRDYLMLTNIVSCP